ncbi:hypothetical protein [Pseudomonas neuropathica]|uniref:Uncharacterized protein n=1 Tax=Pseudomonas neuropathica TaxID=2730425 RepID=A0ACC7MS48_9PSED
MTDSPVTLYPLGQRHPARLPSIACYIEVGCQAGDWPVCHYPWQPKTPKRLKRMKILKKMFANRKAFDYISAPRQTEHV